MIQKITTFCSTLSLQRTVLGAASVAVLSASSYKATQYAQSAWGNWEGMALIVGAAIASFYALHTAFNPTAKKSARFWAAAAALTIASLEGGAIMQGNLDKLNVSAGNAYNAARVTFSIEKTRIDSQYQAALTQWETEKARSETTRGEDHKPLREELQTLQAALAENAASQRSTKASDKDGNVTPAYQALLDQQATLLERSKAITSQLAAPLQLPARPVKAPYPANPVLEPVTLAPVEYAQSFAFPLLVLVIMFLRGRRDEENHAQANLADIQQQAQEVAKYLNTTVDTTEARTHELLTRFDERMEQSLQTQTAAAEVSAGNILRQLEARLADMQRQSNALGRTTEESLRTAGTRLQQLCADFDTHTQQSGNAQKESLQTAMNDLLEAAKSASADLKKQLIQCNVILSKGNVPAMRHIAPVQCTTIEADSNNNADARQKLTRKETLNLLRLQQIELNKNGLIIVEMIQEHTGNGRKLAEKYRDEAIHYGYLLTSNHAGGICCTYPDEIQPDIHSKKAGADSNVYTLPGRDSLRG